MYLSYIFCLLPVWTDCFRRTGLTLKDTGVRDENGFEPVPTFSSPAKSLSQPNGTTHDATNSADDTMDIDQSEIKSEESLTFAKERLTNPSSHSRHCTRTCSNSPAYPDRQDQSATARDIPDQNSSEFITPTFYAAIHWAKFLSFQKFEQWHSHARNVSPFRR